jgi:hypothetical protein
MAEEDRNALDRYAVEQEFARERILETMGMALCSSASSNSRASHPMNEKISDETVRLSYLAFPYALQKIGKNEVVHGCKT